MYTCTLHTCAHHTHINSLTSIWFQNKQSINWCHFHFSVLCIAPNESQTTNMFNATNDEDFPLLLASNESSSYLFGWCLSLCIYLLAKYMYECVCVLLCTSNTVFCLLEWLIYHLFKKSLFLSITRYYIFVV